MTRKPAYNGVSLITSCVGCGATPVRHVEGATERNAANWLLRAPCCGRDLCRVCYPEDATRCRECVAKAAA